DRAARAGPEGKEHLARRDRDGRATGGPTRHAIVTPWVLHRPERRVLVRAPHRELVEVPLADHDRALRVEPLDDGCRIHGYVSLEDARPGSRRDLLRPDDVLARPRNPGQEGRVARAKTFIGYAGLLAGVVVGEMEPRVVAVAVRPLGCEVGKLERAQPPRAQELARLSDRARHLRHGRSPRTACTRKNSPSRPPLGAFPSASSRESPGRISSSRITFETGSTEAVGDTFSVSTSFNRSTAARTTESCPVNRSTSSGVKAMRASPAAFSTTDRSIAIGRSLSSGEPLHEARTEEQKTHDDGGDCAQKDARGRHVLRRFRRWMPVRRRQADRELQRCVYPLEDEDQSDRDREDGPLERREPEPQSERDNGSADA